MIVYVHPAIREDPAAPWLVPTYHCGVEMSCGCVYSACVIIDQTSRISGVHFRRVASVRHDFDCLLILRPLFFRRCEFDFSFNVRPKDSRNAGLYWSGGKQYDVSHFLPIGDPWLFIS